MLEASSQGKVSPSQQEWGGTAGALEVGMASWEAAVSWHRLGATSLSTDLRLEEPSLQGHPLRLFGSKKMSFF